MDHELTKDEIEKYNILVNYHNRMHPNDKLALLTHARNQDHAPITEWVVVVAKKMGIQLGQQQAFKLAFYFMKRITRP